jgi:CHRD domain
MNRRTASIAFIAPALASAVLLLSAGVAFAHEEGFTAELTGTNEVPAGDARLTGKATLTVNEDTGQVCSKVTTNVTGAEAMHLHTGAVGANGPVLVTLDIKSINGANACVPVTAAVANAITASPAGHYVNIHTPGAPGGAVRGQLVASAPSGSDAGTPSGSNAGSGGQAGTNSDPNLALVALMVAGGGLAGAAGWRLVRR